MGPWWECGCGAYNGVNLDKCGRCRYPRSEREVNAGWGDPTRCAMCQNLRPCPHHDQPREGK